MNRIRTSDVVNMILSHLHTKKRINLYDSICEALVNMHPGAPKDEVLEKSEKIRSRIRKGLDKYLEDCSERRLTPRFDWGEYDTEILVSKVYQDVGNFNPVGKYTLTDEIQEFLKDIDPFLFENLCAFLLDKTNCEAVTSRERQDNGIDFGGVLRINAFEDPDDPSIKDRVMQDLSLRIIGQAKRYKDNIKVKDLRELKGTDHPNVRASLARKHPSNRIIQRLQNEEMPVVFFFMTTSDYTLDAENYASEVGMITLNGQQIAQALIKLEIFVYFNGEQWLFNEEGFTSWLTTDDILNS
ncbi:hypothetical protein GLW04_17210 [Halobacillus litoralis]|uniref:Restriction endonuclease type IV Mrr domain-containing protein n=1 Tax=Halobacillus litoralis TaxID=45668 RepID=A0A845E642_9BACI|nr:restriction endonuclease [Halobacillus litoralis]MYL21647.1 hypothetical protein [Halobacillus litoralis]